MNKRQLHYHLKCFFAYFIGISFLAILMLLAVLAQAPAQSDPDCPSAVKIQKFAAEHAKKNKHWIKIWFDEIDAGPVKFLLISREQGFPFYTVVYFDKNQCIFPLNNAYIHRFALTHLGMQEAIKRAELVHSTEKQKGRAS